ncbi:TcaA NTF2-like domain-containing protein [Rossellomorea marisflavi]|uniref:TcaA NTF2-like domain-containing protein n=1 Tax=Rossellomorea marisflavi TaxID=189381 RepID=UPI00345A55EB
MVQKIITASIIVLVGAGVAGHFYIKAAYSPDTLVDQFTVAVKDKDLKKARRVFDLQDIKQETGDKEVKKYLAYLQEDLPELVNQLEGQAASFKEGTSAAATVTDEQGNDLFHFTKGKKFLGIYDTYTLNVIPFTVMTDANLEAYTISLNGQGKVAKEKQAELTGLLPVESKLEASLETSYSTFKEEESLDFTEATENQLDLSIEFAGKYVFLDEYDQEEVSALLVNGKKMKDQVKYETPIGPFPTDGSIEIVAEHTVKDKTYTSDAIKVTNLSSEYLYFEYPELVKEQDAVWYSSWDEEEEDPDVEAELTEFVEDYTYAIVEARNTGDFSGAAPFHDPDGEAYAEAEKYAAGLYKAGTKEEVVDVTIGEIEEDGEAYIVHLEDTFNITTSDGSEKESTFDTIYKVISTDDGYLVNELIDTDKQ